MEISIKYDRRLPHANSINNQIIKDVKGQSHKVTVICFADDAVLIEDNETTYRGNCIVT